MVKKKKLILNTSIYFISSIGTQFLYLIFLKIITNNITTEQYGKYSLLLTVQTMLTIFISLGINSGFSRFFREYKDHIKLRNIALTFSFIWSFFILFVVFLIKDQIGILIFKGDTFTSRYILFITFSSILSFLIEIFVASYLMQYQAKRLVTTEMSVTILNLGLLILFVINLKLGILGILTAHFIARLIVFLTLFLSSIKSFYFIIERESLKKMLLYGTGLIMGNLSSWILTFIDRYFLNFYIGLTTVGIYSIGYILGGMIRPLFINPFIQTFTPFQLQVYKEKNGKEKIRKIFRYYCTGGWTFVLFFSIFGKYAIQILTTPEYIEVFKIIPLIAISFFIFTLTAFFGFGLHVANKMFLNSFIVTLGAFFNIGFNFLLIPKLGMYGAALSTIIPYIFINIIYYYIGKKYWDTNLNFFYPYKVGLSFLFFYLIYFFFIEPMNNISIELILNIALFALYIYSFLLLRYIRIEEIKDIFSPFYAKTLEVKCDNSKNS